MNSLPGRLFCFVLLSGWLTIHVSASAGYEFFEGKIRPVLVERCYECHSAESKTLKGGLRVDSRAGLLAGGDSGPAIVLGKAGESLLVRAISHADEKLQMPPKGPALDKGVVADFAAWIKMGAPDPRTNGEPAAVSPSDTLAEARARWPFHPVGTVSPPAVRNEGWVRNEIDRFILAKLESKQLSPAPAAAKRALIRRATFDLTGLPPTAEEVREFAEDESPEAYGRLLDRLLAAPAYGERWGRHWLDVVRYTDSFDARGIGGEADVPEAYRYRDWVVQALNEDLPYDQFVMQQIAGDLLPAPEPGGFHTNGVIATGVYAMGEWGVGDADKEKMLTDIVDDQIDVTGRAFLGLTLACARCHDHKFDPIPAADYYAMAGIFFSSRILPNPGVKTGGSPTLRIPLAPPGEIARRNDLEQRIAGLGKEMEAQADEAIAAFAANSIPQTAAALEALWQWKHAEPQPALDQIASQAKLSESQPINLQASLLAAWRNLLEWNELTLLAKLQRDIAGKNGVDAWALASGADTPSVTINPTGSEVAITTLTLPARSVSAHPSPKGGVAVAWKAPMTGEVTIAGALADADEKCGDGIDWALRLDSRGRTRELARGKFENGQKSELPAQGSVAVAEGDLLLLVIGPKSGHACDTTTVELAITESAEPKREWSLTRDALAAERTNPFADSFKHKGVWQFFDSGGQKSAGEIASGSSLERFLNAETAEARTSAAQAVERSFQELSRAANKEHPEAKLFEKYISPKSGIWAGLRGDLGRLSPSLAARLEGFRARQEELRQRLPPPFPVTHGFQEGGTPESAYAGFKDARIHLRGRYDRLGDEVPRGFPRVVAGEARPEIKPQSSGRLELARWIASEANPLTARVMANRVWQHHFGEGIVRTPNNFGKLGTPPTHPELLDYLAGEFVKSGWSLKAMHRLIMLSAAYQQSTVPAAESLEADPDNLLFGRMNRRRLESEAIRDSLLAAAGKLDLRLGGKSIRDLEIQRRTLYVMTVRSDRATYQSLFDAADPGAMVEKRLDSTVAPQALFLLNHPFALASAEALAALLDGVSADSRRRIAWLYERLYARPATSAELDLGLQFIHATAQGEAGQASAPWGKYCQALLAANEFVYID